MSVPVIAIIGAGASHASGKYASGMEPPLTRGLFEGAIAQDLLRTYVLASHAGRTVTREMRSDSTIAFEQAVLNLREHGARHRRQMSLALPPYLQALMLAYSQQLHADAERYSVLIDELLTLPTEIYFVSLNYDTLLDANLSAFSALQSIDDYVSSTRQWSLVKPHGSANWYVELTERFDPTAPPEDLVVPEGPIRCAPVRSPELYIVRGSNRRVREHELTTRYPAIALPEGPKDRLVLPREHLDFLKTRLGHAQEIHLLVLGYSALDTEVLDLIAQSGCRVRRMTIVNRDAATALEVYATISSHRIESIWPDTFDGSFEQWIDNDGLRRWIKEFDGPYPSITSPNDLRNRIMLRKAGVHLSGRWDDDIMRMRW